MNCRNYHDRLFIIVIIVAIFETGMFGQKEPVYSPVIRTKIQVFKSGKLNAYSDDTPINYYSNSYQIRMDSILELYRDDVNNVELEFIKEDKWTPEQRYKLDQLEFLATVNYNNQMSYYVNKNALSLDKSYMPESDYVAMVNYFGDVLNSDFISFLFINVYTADQPNETGNYNKDVKGFIELFFLEFNTGSGLLHSNAYYFNPVKTKFLTTTLLDDEKFNKCLYNVCKMFRKTVAKRARMEHGK